MALNDNMFIASFANYNEHKTSHLFEKFDCCKSMSQYHVLQVTHDSDNIQMEMSDESYIENNLIDRIYIHTLNH